VIDATEAQESEPIETVTDRISDDQSAGNDGGTDENAESQGEMARPIVEEAASEKSSTGDHRSYSPLDEGAIDEFDTSREARGKFQTVGDDDQDGLLFGIEFQKQGADFARAVRIEIAGRLIREEQKRLINEGTTEGDALAFASGELAGAVANAFLETDTIEEFEGTIFILC